MYLVWLGSCIPGQMLGQEGGVTARIDLTTDSIAIGRPITATLQIRHPAAVAVEFPTPRDFSPFELVSARPEATRTHDSISVDQVTYTIRTFSLAPLQVLDLPYTWYSRNDTGSGRVLSDSLVLQRRVAILSDSLAYRYDPTPLSLNDPPNYLRPMMLAMGLVLVLGILSLILHKPIRRMWGMRQIRRNWDRVKRALQRLAEEPNQEIQLESLNALWRSYLDPQQKFNLGAMTTTELPQGIRQLNYLSLSDQRALVKAAMLRDQVIFAAQPAATEQVASLIQDLARVFDETFSYRKIHFHKSR